MKYIYQDIYKEYSWQDMKEQVEKWQEMAKQQGEPILTASQNNLNGLSMSLSQVIDDKREQIENSDKLVSPDGSIQSLIFKTRWINKYKDYDDQVLRKFSSVADESGDCCLPEDEDELEDEDEINFFHEDAEDTDEMPLVPYPTGASPKSTGASSKPGGAPSPKHYRRKIKFTDDPKDHQCEAGMTELNGWIICKHCGTNLRKIK